VLDVKKMTESAEECLGWPYVSPGTNDSRGIDCSGLFVKIFRDQGASIYHGSNTIYRKYCTEEKGKLTKASQLCEGMAVFKWNKNTPEKFSDGLGDFQHIGYVASVNPLRIIHASTGTMCVTEDHKIGTWKYYGKLKGVNYEGSSEPEEEEATVLYTAKLMGGNTAKPIHIRIKPDGMLLDDVPQGTAVEVISQETGKDSEWCQVRYPDGKRTGTGYVKKEFVVPDGEIPAEDIPGGKDPAPDAGGDRMVNISLSVTPEAASALLPVLDKLVDQLVSQVGRG
jgi:hypothetical protein